MVYEHVYPDQPPSLQRRDLSSMTYGLVEEDYADDAFRLLVVCIFLNKTPGARAIPQANLFFEKYTSPGILAEASFEEVVFYFRDLGLKRRAWWLIELARTWRENPPQPYQLYTKKRNGQVLFESEVAHLKGVGRYANDAWRIFCKDRLYGREGVDGPEWKKVVPKDKELRGYIKWKWAKEGYDWHSGRDEELYNALDSSLSTAMAKVKVGTATTQEPLMVPFPGGCVRIWEDMLRDAQPLTTRCKLASL